MKNMKNMKKKKLGRDEMTVAEAAAYLGITRQTLHAAVVSKRLRSRKQMIAVIKNMSVTVFDKSDLDDFASTISRSQQQRGLLKKRKKQS